MLQIARLFVFSKNAQIFIRGKDNSRQQSKKLRLYAAKNDMQLSEVIEKLINKEF